MTTIPELAAENKSLRIRWVMIGFAFLATVLNYIHRLSFNYLSANGELRKLIPDDAFGYIGTAFFVAYCVYVSLASFICQIRRPRVSPCAFRGRSYVRKHRTS